MAHPLNHGDCIMVGWVNNLMYNGNLLAKCILESLALRALRYVEIQTGFLFAFDHIAIAYTFLHFYFHFSNKFFSLAVAFIAIQGIR